MRGVHGMYSVQDFWSWGAARGAMVVAHDAPNWAIWNQLSKRNTY
jgi:hypothetical protein